ncbi:MAG TPA: ferredoxin:protochlorophyllide reductase (ATP-dependent) subunit B, partial [Myxococcota bacterium]|nr:ferredoxin:protochlorophyllide reductase (ATP-dependent) subunit B [Myxococcota bacterium]
YSPQMGFEGANVIFDTWIHPLLMGLEEHLLTMFRDDFEFHDDAVPSHLASTLAEGASPLESSTEPALEPRSEPDSAEAELILAWQPEAASELRKIPFFVRGKARRNTERYAAERGLESISLETLYDAKAHFGR